MSFEKIKRIFKYDGSLNRKVFWVVGIVTTLFSIVSSITTMVEHLGLYADLATAGCSVLLVALLIITYFNEKYDDMYVFFCLALILLLMPLNFFCCGGIRSGMPMYFIVSILICALALEKKKRITLTVIGFIAFISCFVLGRIFPDMVTEITDESAFIDILITFIITGIGMSLIIHLLISEYQKASNRLQELNIKLEDRTKLDMLTGLYNRSALFDYFESDQFNSDTDLYLAMFDIDNFRAINDNFGHQFGDEVLKRLGDIISASEKAMIGEIAARYGSEEFVYVISADDYPSAVRKADNIRTEFGSINWEGKPGLHITISGGITKCNNTSSDMAEQALKSADESMLIAKAEGKNRIKRSGSGIVINNIVFRT